MGSFSFYRADKTTKQANFIGSDCIGGDTCKLLIPKEFVEHYGCETIKSRYYDYGMIEYKKPNGGVIELDLYGFIAYINRDMYMPHINGKNYGRSKIKDHYIIKGEGGMEDTAEQFNRLIGIKLACYPKDHRKCKYKLKLCSPSYRGNYEDLCAFSTSDRAQGWSVEHWTDKDYDGKTVAQHYEEECITKTP